MKIEISKKTLKFLNELQPKHAKQIAIKALSLAVEPRPIDSAKLKGRDDLLRVDSGEYRIIYRIEEDMVKIIVIGKRNDVEVYKNLTFK